MKRFTQSHRGFRTFVLTILLLAGCTDNNGDIGPLFGTWHLEHISSDKGDYIEPSPTMFWMFQSSVVCFQTLSDFHESYEDWASWQIEDNKMVINLDNHDDSIPPGIFPYEVPDIAGFPKTPCKMYLDILQLDSKYMSLKYFNNELQATYTYELKKYY